MILSMLFGRRLAATALTLATLAACGGGESGGARDAPADEAADPVIATTSIWADVTSEVACGELIRGIIPAGADPHSFEPSLRDRELVEQSTTIISNGLGLEETLDDLLDTASAGGINVIEMANDVDVITHDDKEADDKEADDHDADNHDADNHNADNHDEADEHDADNHETDHDETSDHQHDHGGAGDPHIWQDPLRVAGTLDTIASALAAHDVETCADEYRDELVVLDAAIVEALAVVPDSSRVLVTSHESLAYFADRYGFEVVGTVIPSTSTLAESNAADLAALADVIETHDIPAIFTEELESTADADALARRLGVAIVPLVTDSLTDDPDTDSYVEMMRNNATAIAAALAP